MAAKEAARKAALVEASWCRILKAARIQSKEAEAQPLEVDKAEAEAFEEATAVGVIMYDKPNCPRKPCKIETSIVNGGGSTTHTFTESFETAFEVDKEVAAAVKIALVRLGNYPSFDKDEFKELLQKISENPDTDTVENNHESSEFTSECESESGSELKAVSQKDNTISNDLNQKKMADLEARQRKTEAESKLHDSGSTAETLPQRIAVAKSEIRKKQPASELPMQEAKDKRNKSTEGAAENSDRTVDEKASSETIPGLGSILLKHGSKFERDIEEAKKNSRGDFEMIQKNSQGHKVSSEAIPWKVGEVKSSAVETNSLHNLTSEAKETEDGKGRK
ncbi:uncharacterized protein [Pyrus communis]|uniref:uncharacterized protein n=1 Tax=Pyrus communis TaxID=23211 RepID=UPI0035C25145